MTAQAITRRLWASTTIDTTSGCWTWTGTLDRNGYGKVAIDGHTHQVHRLAYLTIGPPLADQLTLDHTCRNRACWNPAHLDPCTIRDNILRGESPTAQNARRTHCKHGHPFDETNTRWRHRPGRNPERQCKACDRLHDEARRSTRRNPRSRARAAALPQGGSPPPPPQPSASVRAVRGAPESNDSSGGVE